MFNVEARKSLLARLQGKSIQYFAQAVREICEAYDNLISHDPTNPSEHGNIATEVLPDETGDALSEEARVVTGTEKDHLVKSDHCLSKSDETIPMHTGSTFSCLADEKVASTIPREKKKEISTGAHSHCTMVLLETANNLSPTADDAAANQSKVALKKCTDQVISAYYTRRPRIKKSKVETDGFEGVTNAENVDYAIHSKVTQKSTIGFSDLSIAVAGSMREEATEDRSVAEYLPDGLKSVSEISDAKEACGLMKRKKVVKVEGKVDASKDHLQGGLSEMKCKVQLLSKKADAADNERSFRVSEKLKGVSNDETDKKPQAKKQKIDSSNGTAERDKKLSGPNLREETSTVPRKGNLVDLSFGDGAAIALGKECILALEASSTSFRISEKKVIDMPTADILISAKTKPLSAQSRVKRRAVCIVDNVEERPRTPVHGGLIKKTKILTPVVRPTLKHDALNHKSQSRQLSGEDLSGSEIILIEKRPKSSKSHSQHDLVKAEMKDDNVSHLPGSAEFETFLDPKNVQGPESSQVLMQSDAAQILDTHTRMRLSGTVTNSGDTRSTLVYDVSSSHLVGMSQAQNSTLRNKSTHGEGSTITSKVRPMLHHAAVKTSSEKSSSLEGM